MAGRISIPGCVVFLCDGPWRGNGPRASGMPPTHDGGKTRERQGLAWYSIRGSYDGGGSPHPRAPALPSPCNPPLGRSSGRVHPENVPITHTHTHTHAFCLYHYGLQGSSIVIVCRPTGAREVAELRGNMGPSSQLAIRPVGRQGDHKQTRPVLGTPRRSIRGSSTGWTG